jgi:hypothetical protein
MFLYEITNVKIMVKSRSRRPLTYFNDAIDVRVDNGAALVNGRKLIKLSGLAKVIVI